MTRRVMFAFLAVFAGLVYLLHARMNPALEPKKPGHLGLLVDNSTSQHPDCSGLPTLVAGMSRDMKVGSRSTLSVFTLGSKESRYEPVQQIPPTPFSGGGGNFGRHQLEEKIRGACMRFGEVPASSIFRGVQVVLKHLEALGCGAPNTAPCRLWVQSDGDETVSRERFGGTKGTASLKNQGIEVLWCGYAVTEGSGGPRGDESEALIAAWHSSFTDPAIVTFMPFCPGQSASLVITNQSGVGHD